MKILLSFVGLWAFCFVIHCATGADTATNAVYQCSALHQIDLSKLQTNGTDFTVSGCRLKCIIDGILISNDPVNEGSACNVPNGICHNGACVHQIAHPTTVGPTIAPTPAPIYPFGYTFTQLNVTVQHAVLHDSTLKPTDILFVEYSHHSRSHAESCETKWYFPVPNLEWHAHCLFTSEKLPFVDSSLMQFYFYVNDKVRAYQRIPIVLTFRKYLVDHPNISVTADGRLEFLQVINLVNSANTNQKLADLYVKFEFINVTKVIE